MYSINNSQQIQDICDDIITKLKGDASVKEEKEEIKNDNKINDKEKEVDKNPDKIFPEIKEDKNVSNDIQKIKIQDKEKDENNLEKKDDNNLDEKKEEKNEESDFKNNNNENNNNENNNDNNKDNNLQFIFELPAELREEILRELDFNTVNMLPQDLRREYDRIMNRNQEININREEELFPFEFQVNYDIAQSDLSRSISIRNNYLLRRLKYKKKKLLILFDENNNNNSEKNDEDILINFFEDQFLENMIIYDLKSILVFKKKSKKPNEYSSFLNKLINNEILRYKILDILFNLWICDTSHLVNLIKSEKNIQSNNKNNSLLDKLHYLYIQLDLTENYFFEDFERFFINFATNNQKYMKKYFLQTFFDEKGDYIYNGKKFEITENSKNLKKILNIEYKTKENVLNNLINLTLVNNGSNLKIIFSLKIFTVIVQNCLKNDKKEDKYKNKEENKGLNISIETLEKILNLFNEFEVTLFLSKGQKSNNPTILLVEMLKDKKIFEIMLDVLLKRFKALKDNISNDMDDFLANKKIDITLFNKILIDIVLFKLVKFLSFK